MANDVYVSFETGGDFSNTIGDIGNYDYWIATRFVTSDNISCTAAALYLVVKNGNPVGDMTFRIETDDNNKPSGTLAHANAAGTIPNGDLTLWAWNIRSFSAFTLPAGTYWLVNYIPAQTMNVSWNVYCDLNGIGVSGKNFEGGGWTIYTNLWTNYYRIYGTVVAPASKFRDEICFRGLPGGFAVRGSINKEFIYAVKNNQQRKYAYFIPTNPQTVDQQAWRAKFTAGVAAALILTDDQKDEYRKDAYRKKGQTWFTRFMTQYLWAESHS